MKQIILGILIGLTINQAAKALTIQLEYPTVRDLFAGLYMCGLASNPACNLSREDLAKASFIQADITLKYRGR